MQALAKETRTLVRQQAGGQRVVKETVEETATEAVEMARGTGEEEGKCAPAKHMNS